MVRRAYPSDLTPDEWALLEPLLPPPSKMGRPRQTDMFELINAIRYITRGGCSWRMLPHDFEIPWETAYGYFWRWKKSGVWKQINDELVHVMRTLHGRKEQPTLAIIDSQTVKTTEKGGLEVTTRARSSMAASATSL